MEEETDLQAKFHSIGAQIREGIGLKPENLLKFLLNFGILAPHGAVSLARFS